MRAVVLRSHGGPEVLGFEEVPDPIPGPDEVLVRIRATALNRADVLQRMGGYADPRPHVTLEIPGLEYSGVVEAVGDRVTRWKQGDAVMAIESGGAYAELICTHERQLMPVPSSIDLGDAAAIPEVFLTAWDALVRQGGLTSGRWALVHAGASGVGTAAIQIVNAIGARIAVTCSESKMALCRDLGAHVVLERSPNDWSSAARSAVPGGFDVILDVVGGDEVERNLQMAKTRGTIVQVGLMGGASTQVNVGLLLMKRLTWIGTTLRARPLEEKIAVTQQFIDEVVPLFDNGSLRPVIDSRYALDEIAEAHRAMGENRNSGKILIDVAAR
ncbi:MAG: NAD(P)H-quinone oxidoreductase [Ilumatobacteraceae bacterium]